MRTSLFSLCILTALLLLSCKGKDSGKKKVTQDTATYFQVADFIQSEINDVNQTPYFIYKTTIRNERKDSIAINTALFKQIATGFLHPDINDSKLKPEYKENIFADQTTNSITFSYTTPNKSLEIQNVDVLMDENGQKVKRIFIRKFFNYADSSAIEQLTWKPGESFQINRSVSKADNSEVMLQTTVVWNPKR